jgi:hypothetical protein
MNSVVKDVQDNKSVNRILQYRSKFKLSNLFIIYSGKERRFDGTKMKKETSSQSLPVYTASIKDGKVILY